MLKIGLGKIPYHLSLQRRKIRLQNVPGALKRQAAGAQFDARTLLWFSAAFFISRASIMGEITPFALI
ncbi:MAG: hypothetical protein GX244_03365, partial [Firmicutes bacterium]|nr:hypothetical protein [Bacillota bacterium]